jgi:DNA modification methylase
VSWHLEHGDCIAVMATLAEASVDAVVADPPYGIGFMGHEWDQALHKGKRNGNPASGRFGRSPAIVAGRYDNTLAGNRIFAAWCEEWARECLRVLKPGGHLLAFGSTRTYHRLASGVEEAGFEIRGQIDWLFGEGFPKALNIAKALDKAAGIDTRSTRWTPTTDEAKAWIGWQTHLKPGHEPIAVARKPAAVRSVARNVVEHGTGALNIGACRIPVAAGDEMHGFNRGYDDHPFVPHDDGRFPADVILDHLAAGELDDQSGPLTSGANPTRRGTDKFRQIYGNFAGQRECHAARGADVGGASRFYYCAKTGHVERHAGCDAFGGNPHPTPKPIDLMRWLVRLVAPPGAVVLDPFAGSGSTGIASVLEGFDFIGIEREPLEAEGLPYVDVARARIAYWEARPEGPSYPPRRRPPDDQVTLDELLDAERKGAAAS